MQITLLIQNGNQSIFNALKAFLKTYPELDFKIEKNNSPKISNGYTKEFEAKILKENEATMKAYKSGKIKSYLNANVMHEDIFAINKNNKME
ncbi:hypothetical protein [Campylobacter sp. JMF_08 NE1]|uniref:hypothetical protein n=1 Tax=Campylobacter sp. JMF_08 NE1 TaxID=2983821 RepID=UPI0022E9CDC1|nr:hypothetical protein [Campylobacter sp. JMF_08 NE1]MDA3048220.1 hypothetical protein [Campylobacter sp. JMF_08 NE1]